MSIEKLFLDTGLRPQNVFFIPVRDKNGFPQDKALRVFEGSKLHKQILETTGGKMPEYFQELQ